MILSEIQTFFTEAGVLYTSPVALGVALVWCVFLLGAVFLEYFPHTRFALMVDMLYEKVEKFYGDILWEQAWGRVKTYIITLFFVILVANIVGIALDFVAPIFWTRSTGEFFLAEYIIVPTSDMQFNLALAAFSTLLLLYIQFGSLGAWKFFYNYLPLWGKWYIVAEQWKLPKYLYYPLAIVAKIGDVIISLFLWFLDIIGLFAKIISLSFRLFWNMTSGTILLGMLVVGTSSMSNALTHFIGGIELPIVLPILVYLQGFLVAGIQAMVFPLLVAIFIRMAMGEKEEKTIQT